MISHRLGRSCSGRGRAAPERLDDRIVEAVSHRAHWRQESGIDRTLKAQRCELRALVAVADRGTLWATLVEGHAEGVGDERCTRCRIDGPVDDAA